MPLKTVSNPFELIYDDKIEAKMTHLKSQLVILIVSKHREDGITQKELADKLGVSQPRISNLFNGRLDKFSIDMLLKFTLIYGCNISHVLSNNDGNFTLELMVE